MISILSFQLTGVENMQEDILFYSLVTTLLKHKNTDGHFYFIQPLKKTLPPQFFFI